MSLSSRVPFLDKIWRKIAYDLNVTDFPNLETRPLHPDLLFSRQKKSVTQLTTLQPDI